MGGLYDFYKNFCVCPGTQVYIGMRDLDGQEATSFPVYVYDVNEVPIGFAYTKEQYISVWNSSEANREVGVLSGLIGPFSFTLTLIPGQNAPLYVIGDSEMVSSNKGLVDANGELLIDANGEILIDL